MGSSAFAHHYSRNHVCSLFLRVLRCFSSPRSPLHRRCQASSLTGSPIRTSGHHGLFAPTPGFSQLVTSFFASESQGIPRTLLLDFLVSSFNCKSFLTFDSWPHLLDAVSPLMCLFSQYVNGLCAPRGASRIGGNPFPGYPIFKTGETAFPEGMMLASPALFRLSSLERRYSSHTFRYGYLVTT